MNQGKIDAELKQKKAEKSLQDFIFAQKEDVRRFKAMEKSLKDVSTNLSGKDTYITSLIKENDLLTNRVKIARNRLERFKKEEIGKLEKLLHERESEVEVLKEMLKGGSTQVR